MKCHIKLCRKSQTMVLVAQLNEWLSTKISTKKFVCLPGNRQSKVSIHRERCVLIKLSTVYMLLFGTEGGDDLYLFD